MAANSLPGTVGSGFRLYCIAMEIPGTGQWTGRRRSAAVRLGSWWRGILLFGCFCVGGGVLTAAGDADLRLINGGFEQGLRGWTAPRPAAGTREAPGRGFVLAVTGACMVVQDIPIEGLPGAVTAAVDVQVAELDPSPRGGYAFAAVYQLDGAGALVAFTDFAKLAAPCAWQRVSTSLIPDARTRVLSLRCGIYNAGGEAEFDNWTLARGNAPMPFVAETDGAARSAHPGGTVAILREAGFPTTGRTATPEQLAAIFRGGGAAVEFLGAAALADPLRLRPGRIDLLVLPCGETFPAAARPTFSRYLRGGGCFLSLGGYAFSRPLSFADGRWVPEAEVLSARAAEALHTQCLVPDPGFESDRTRQAPVGGSDRDGAWFPNSAGAGIEDEGALAGRRCAVARAGTPGPEVKWDLALPARPGRTYRVSGALRTADVAGPGFAYLAIYQFDEAGALVTFRDFAQQRGASDWRTHTYTFSTEPRTALCTIKVGIFRATGTAWFDEVRLADVTGLQWLPMNTRTGKPEDGLRTAPAQMGLFDADYPLKRSAALHAAAGQTIFPPATIPGPCGGWAASGVRGNDATRWIPLLEGRDRYDLPRGAAGALLLHYSGFYEGSSWAFFGVEDRALFEEPEGPLAEGLRRLLRFLLDGVYLRNLTAGTAGVYPGEEATVSVAVENRGATRPSCGVLLEAVHRDSGKTLWSRTVETAPLPGRPATAGGTFRVPEGSEGLCVLRARLDRDGAPGDILEQGMVVLSRAPPELSPLRLRDNYLRLGDRAVFLFGSDNYGNVYQSSAEGPLWWDREHAASRDFGLTIYENLQYTRPNHRFGEQDWRNALAMAQSAHAHGLVFMPGMLIGHDVAVDDEGLAQQSALCAEYARRLGHFPRILWYLNGDYRLGTSNESAAEALWNRWLREQYPDPAALAAAWGTVPAPEAWGRMPFPPARWAGPWDQRRAVDALRFRAHLVRRWNTAHVDAVRALEPERPITSEYYSTPFDGIDLRLSIDGQDLSNIGFFAPPETDLDVLPLRIRWNDLRSVGRSVGLGEYGVKTHPAWTVANGAVDYHIVRSEAEQSQLFQAIAFCGFGLGCSRVQNWCLRDSNQNVFPWGVFHPGPLVPKDVACVHRNLVLLFRPFEPVYRPPPLTVLLCDGLRLGNHPALGTEAGYRCFETLLGLRADFNVLGDSQIGHLPAASRALVYPAALGADETLFEALHAWVAAGGRLLVTGDPAWRADRGPAPADRFTRFFGARREAGRYLPHQRPEQPGQSAVWNPAGKADGALRAAPMATVHPEMATVVAATDDGAPLLLARSLGLGRLFWCTDPMELGADAGSLRSLYAWFLEQAAVEPLPVQPRDPGLHAYVQPTREGEVMVLYGRDRERGFPRVEVSCPAGRVVLGVRRRHPGLVAYSRGGSVRAVAGDGPVSRDGRPVVVFDGQAGVVSLDGADIGASRAVMLLPLEPCTIRLELTSVLRAPVVVLGSVRDGHFRALEREHPDGPVASVVFDPDRASLFGVLCEESETEHWLGQVTRMLTHPERSPGT
ncbi:MAG: beta-galactosidase [Lentisphaeria bacterium]|nr:beta-galactosidase [Lentisphaeria bacterium]